MTRAGHGGDRIAEVLERQGVRFVFTLCGGHISPILVAAKARGIRVIDVRHEASAVLDIPAAPTGGCPVGFQPAAMCAGATTTLPGRRGMS